MDKSNMKKLSVVFLFLSLILAQTHFVTAKNILTRHTRQNNWRSRRETVRIGKYINNIHRVIARLGASPKILIIDKDIALEADVNIPDNITVKIMENGSITLGDYDLIIHNIEAGPHPFFICNGTGEVTLGSGTTGIYPQWFGAKGDGLADDTVALQNTLHLSSDTGIPIIITEGSMFKTTDRLYCYGKCTMKGSGENCVISLDETIADHWINIGISAFSIEGDWATGSFEQVHFQINNSSFAGDALFLHRVNGFSLKNCIFTLNNSCSGIKAGNNPAFTLNPYHNNIEITGCRMIASQEAEGGKGIDLSHSTTVTITDNYIFGIGDDPIALHDCEDFKIENNSCFSVTGRIASLNSIYGVIANNHVTRPQFCRTKLNSF